jgi:hypothetical protein
VSSPLAPTPGTAPSSKAPPPPRRGSSIGNLHYKVSAVLVVIVVASAGLIYELESTHKSSPLTPSTTCALTTPICHVIVLFMEDQSLNDILANGTYERYLAENYAFAGNFSGVTSDSLANYKYATSGQDSAKPSLTIASLVQNAGLTWAEYAESQPAPCWTTSTTANTSLPSSVVGNQTNHTVFDISHVPFANYYNITHAGGGYCQSHLLPLTGWYDALANDSLPNYVWVTPNDTDNDHQCPPVPQPNAPIPCPGAIPHGDAWLRAFLSPFINSSAFANSVILLGFDYDYLEQTPPGTPGHVYFAAISPYTRHNYTSSQAYSDDSILTTSEYLLDPSGRTGHGDNWLQSPPMFDLFNFYSTYWISGSVSYQGHPVADAKISGNGYNATTSGQGRFSFGVSNGNYTLIATSPDGSCSTSVSAIPVLNSNVTVDFALPCP